MGREGKGKAREGKVRQGVEESGEKFHLAGKKPRKTQI